MIKKNIILLCSLIALPGLAQAETVGIFYSAAGDNQINFAANDIKAALEAKNHTVETFALSALDDSYPNKKIVIALSSDSTTTSELAEQGGSAPSTLSPQGYALRTTDSGQKSYWVLGKDLNGAMYGGLQVAENISFYDFSRDYTEDAKPTIENRGIKLNLALDENSKTYFNSNISTGVRFSIAQVWDYSFWTTWFDEMARNRFNQVSVWNNHPFTSMVDMSSEYPGIAINDVTGYPNYDTFESSSGNNREPGLIKRMTIAEKIVFWKNVMSYAKSRGFAYYLINWNLFIDGAEGKHGLSRSITDPETKVYMKKCMVKLLQTYPDLDGFGVTQGEAMDGTDAARNKFLGDTYGAGMAEYANANPTRKLNFIHRWWLAEEDQIKTNFASLLACPNVQFDMSFKYSFAHMYSSTEPDLMGDDEFNFLENNTLRTPPNSKVRSWLTVRNDSFYYLNWGSPQYARDYINRIYTLPGANEWFKGFYMGSDGYNPTRTFFSKLSTTQGQLEVQRMWYMNKIWGRLSYDKNTTDDVFKAHLKHKLSLSSADSLFNAWRDASDALPIVGEMIFKDNKNDQGWYPELCQGESQFGPDYAGFLLVNHFADASPNQNSEYASYAATASNNLGGKTSAFVAAQRVSDKADSALASISSLNPAPDSELGISVNTVKAMAYLSKYYSHKMRAAVYHKQNNTAQKTAQMRLAYPWWIQYTNLMHSMFKGMEMQRNVSFKDWHEHDAKALSGAGGSFANHTITTNATNGTVVRSNTASNYPMGTVVTLTATPNAGFVFTGWTGDVLGQENPLKVTVGSNMTVGANFAVKTAEPLPWNERFYGSNDGKSDGFPTSWTATRGSGTFIRQSDRFVIKDSGGVGVFETGDINISGANVAISLEVQSRDGLNTAPTPDFVKLYKIVDDGSPVLVDQLIGSAVGTKTLQGTHSSGSNLKLRIEASVNATGEFYTFDNLKVVNQSPGSTYSLNTSAVNGSVNPSGGSFAANSVIQLTASPAAGYVFSNWSGDLSGSSNPGTLTMNANKNVTANFAPDSSASFTLTETSPNGLVTFNPPGPTYTANTVVTVTSVPAVGYSFASWSGDLSGTNNPTTITMNSNKTITANTTLDPIATYTLTETSPNGSVSFSPAGPTYPAGTVVTVTSNPAVGYTFTGWSGSLSGTTNPTTITMNSNKSITANTAPASSTTYTLTETSPNGSVSFSPAGPTYPAGTVVTVTSNPAVGYTFTGWGGSLSGTTNPTTITMNSNKSITANTAPASSTTYTLTETSPNGTVSFSPVGPTYSANTVVTVTAVPAAGFVFTGWTGNLSGTTNPTTITMNSNKSITANTSSSWQTLDVGAVGAAGSAVQSGNTWTIKGSGVDIWGAADEFRYVYQATTDDSCSITARVADLTNTNEWAKAGVMIRETTDANAQCAMVCVTPSRGVSFQWRTTTGGNTLNANVQTLTAPKWLRLTRTGNSFAASYLNDSNVWTPVGTPQSINMRPVATYGIAVTSKNDGVLCTSTFDNVTAAP